MLTIHGRNNSSNVQKVVWALNEMKVPYERTDAGGAFGIVNTPDYLAMNPNARVPTMDEDGFILWESNAIVRYLANKHDKGGLCPSDPRQHADADRWMDWQQTTLGPTMTPIFWNLVRTPEPDRDMKLVESSKTAMVGLGKIIDDALNGRAFLAGDGFTMADIPAAIQIYRWVALVEDRPSLPNLEAWYDRLCQREAFKTNVLDIPLT
ncbi:MAG: glutathione S-transferase family protein [Alphaproteobacteria bacterium]|jgi:glutathione S-transferase|nr:glutathione S-transferase family protein [Alphaproteobacteria bacterium]